MSPRTRRGFSLAEVMIFMLLLGMLITGMYLLLVAGLRNVQRSSVYQETQTQAFKAVRALVNEIANARAENAYIIYDAPKSNRIAVLSGFLPYPGQQDRLIYPDAATNPVAYGVIWQKWVGFCRDAPTDRLLRFEDARTGQRTANGRCYACVAHGIPTPPGCLDVSFPSYKTPAYPAVTGGVSSYIATPTPPNSATPGGNWDVAHMQVVARNIYSLEFEPAVTTIPTGIRITLYASDENSSNRVTQVRYQVTAWMMN